MNVPNPARAKLIVATLMLVVVGAFATLHDIGARSSAEAAVRVGAVVFSAPFIYIGVFSSALLNLIWGWGLALFAPALAIMCASVFRGTVLTYGLIAVLAAVVGGYLLLMDVDVRNYRQGLKRKRAA